MSNYPEFGQTRVDPNVDDNNNTKMYVEVPDVSWELGMQPVDDEAGITTKIIGNAQLGVGIKAPMLDVATPLVIPPAIIVVLQVPAMYVDAEGRPSAMAVALKDIFESHAKSVTGIDISYSNESVGQTLVGADGQNIVSPGKTTRAQPSPSFSFTEVTGNLYWNIFRKWVTDIQNPDTYGIGPGVNISGAWTMSDYSMTFMAIQPDITHRPERIIDAAVYCNVFPQGTGDLNMSRELNQMKNGERSITFNSIVQHNYYTKQLGKLMMSKLALHKLDFNWAPPQRNDVTQSLDGIGIQTDAEYRNALYGAEGFERDGGVDVLPSQAKLDHDRMHRDDVESNVRG